MKALISSFHQALSLSEPPPWKPRRRIRHSPIMRNLSDYSGAGKARVQLNAKGFAGSPATGKEPAPSKPSGQNDSNDDDDAIPDAVYNRIILRILGFVGVPLGFGAVLLKIFEAVKEQKVWDVPIWVPFLTTFLTFGASTMGIAYGTLSASLDPEKKGSMFGWEEAQKNWVEMWKEEEGSDR